MPFVVSARHGDAPEERLIDDVQIAGVLQPFEFGRAKERPDTFDDELRRR